MCHVGDIIDRAGRDPEKTVRDGIRSDGRVNLKQV